LGKPGGGKGKIWERGKRVPSFREKNVGQEGGEGRGKSFFPGSRVEKRKNEASPEWAKGEKEFRKQVMTAFNWGGGKRKKKEGKKALRKEGGKALRPWEEGEGKRGPNPYVGGRGEGKEKQYCDPR